MEYHEAASFLFDLRRFPPTAAVQPTRDLLAHLDHPEAGLTVVQVAGSNGKGSTARMVERALRAAGLTVGLYTSPHLDDVRERIRVDGRPMRKAAVADFVAAVRPYAVDRAAAGESPTFFETLTAMAIHEFDRQDVDVAVLEVGIGGRYDATSAVDADAAGLTSVTLEHADVLGDTVAEIARDKAHVAPADRPLVTAATGEALAGARAVAGEVLTVGTAGEDGSAPDVTVAYRGRDGLEGVADVAGEGWSVEARLALLGAHQARNAGVAAALARQVADVDAAALRRGLRNAHWPGRFEVMGREPLVVLDGAHNPGAAATLADTLSSFDVDDLHLVFGAMNDKDHAGIADALPAPAHAYACRPATDRAEPADTLAGVFERRDVDATAVGDVDAALAAALEAADPGDCVLVTGSLYTVATARRRWTDAAVPKRLPDRPSARAALADADVGAATADDAAGAAVHRTLELRVEPRTAAVLEREMARVGGACTASALAGQDRERVAAALAGTLAEFDALLEALADHDHLARTIRRGIAAAGGGPAPADPAVDDADLPWSDGTAVMGILNVTPDSFHDGGRYEAVEDAVARAEEMVAAGADVVDVGGESTRPGAEPVPAEAERERVVPVIERLADLDVAVSVDTRKAGVARAALAAGADVLNDVSGLADPEMRLVAADHDVPVVVMHSIDAPVDPDREVAYDDVVADVLAALTERVVLAEKAGLDRSQILVDPGLGFGKAGAESFELLDRLDEFRALGCPVMVGHSHKSMLAGVAGDGDRGPATVAATALAAERGADVVRVHDVAENVAAVRTVEAAREGTD